MFVNPVSTEIIC